MLRPIWQFAPGATAGSPSSARRVPLPARPAVRRGVTIIEVLFAILVVVVGLFGALALLPAAVAQARKARTAEALAVAGLSGVHEFDTRGMRKTSNWLRWNSTPPQFIFEPVNPLTGIPLEPVATSSYCIDPRMIAAVHSSAPPLPPVELERAHWFPYTFLPADPRMHRITLWNGVAAQQPLSRILADSIFTFDDDLSYIRNEDDKTREAYQQWDRLPADSGITNPFARRPTRRQTKREMSWMATLVPKLDRYSGRFTDTYVLSIVVFHQRPTGFGIDPVGNVMHTDPINIASNEFADITERTVNAAMVGDGVTGGEVLLTTRLATLATQYDEAAAELRLRPNDWILLAGAVTTSGPPAPRFQWYRVSDVEAEVEFNGTNWERYVTLIGRDWDAVSMPTPTVTIVEGVIGVYEKTIKLESGL